MKIRILLCCLLLKSVLLTRAQPAVHFPKTQDRSISYQGKALDSLIGFCSYKAIFFGECHTVFFEPDFKFRLICQLHETCGIRDVFMEIGHSAAFLFNGYLETGDTSLLYHPRLAYMYQNGNYASFWRNLYLYNKGLAEADKIRIYGVDFERVEVFKVLLSLMPAGREIPGPLLPVFEKIKVLSVDTTLGHFDKRFAAELKTLADMFRQEENAAKNFYGAAFPQVADIVRNESPHTTHVDPRNKAWAAYMESVIRDQHIDKFVAFFGSAHMGYSYGHSMPNKIKALSGFEKKVLSINSVYFNVLGGQKNTLLPYAGLIKGKNRDFLFRTYLPGTDRAVVYRAQDIQDAELSRSADYVLLVDESL
ncbi:MAG TPA: hypothetical protein VL092_06425 [Chitinophagaceae bacterium]|nr:hypothetical protein [Chitinophagaceae bacterium]